MKNISNAIERSEDSLAINGGSPLCKEPFPPRLAMVDLITQASQNVAKHYRNLDLDPEYQGYFEEEYCNAFSRFMGGGYCDAVATGTAALFVAISALQLPRGSNILVSSISDPGTYSAIILNNCVPKLVDTMPGSYNISAKQVRERIDKNTTALLVVHAVGEPVDMNPIMELAIKNNFLVIEDCSQAHGAGIQNQPVGSFGHIAAFSTGYKKNHVTGSSGGLVFSKDIHFFRTATAYADRGKQSWTSDYNEKDPSNNLFPALNLNSDEISCAIGILSLNKLPETIVLRKRFIDLISKTLLSLNSCCIPYKFMGQSSPFFLPITLSSNLFGQTAETFAIALQAEGIPLNPNYKYVAARWNWLKPYLADNYRCKNAEMMVDSSFNLYLNENYGEIEAEIVQKAISKVEKGLSKGKVNDKT